MSRRVAISVALLLLICVSPVDSPAQFSSAAKSGPLTCHKVVCPLPSDACHVLASDKCVSGGGPPQCPSIINAPDGTLCNDGNACTTGDACTAGVCGGAPVVCTSTTDTCDPTSGTCSTSCGPAGCTVASVGTGDPTLTIPSGALSNPLRVTMLDLGSDSSDPSVFHVYEFGPTGTTFSTPATVDLPAPPLSNGQIAVIEVSDDGVTWTQVNTTMNNGRVSGPISHFSL